MISGNKNLPRLHVDFSINDTRKNITEFTKHGYRNNICTWGNMNSSHAIFVSNLLIPMNIKHSIHVLLYSIEDIL